MILKKVYFVGKVILIVSLISISFSLLLIILLNISLQNTSREPFSYGKWNKQKIGSEQYMIAKRDFPPYYSDLSFKINSLKPITFYIDYLDNFKGEVNIYIAKDNGIWISLGKIQLTNSMKRKTFSSVISQDQLLDDRNVAFGALYIVVETYKAKFYIQKAYIIQT